MKEMYGKLKVATHHLPSPRQRQMTEEYVKSDNERLEAQDEEENMFYSLTELGRREVLKNETGI